VPAGSTPASCRALLSQWRFVVSHCHRPSSAFLAPTRSRCADCPLFRGFRRMVAANLAVIAVPRDGGQSAPNIVPRGEWLAGPRCGGRAWAFSARRRGAEGAPATPGVAFKGRLDRRDPRQLGLCGLAAARLLARNPARTLALGTIAGFRVRPRSGIAAPACSTAFAPLTLLARTPPRTRSWRAGIVFVSSSMPLRLKSGRRDRRDLGRRPRGKRWPARSGGRACFFLGDTTRQRTHPRVAVNRLRPCRGERRSCFARFR